MSGDVAARSLKNFASQSGVQVLISAELGRKVHTQPVKGRFTPREALELMLAQTGLGVKEDEKSQSMAIIPAKSPETPPPSAKKKHQNLATQEL